MAPSIRLWSLLFKALTITSNLTFEDDKASSKCGASSSTAKTSTGASTIIVQHEEFSNLLSSFLSSPSVDDMVNFYLVRKNK